MKKLILCIVMLFTLIEVSAQYHVTVVGSKNGTVTLRSTGYGKKASKASIDAELSAIKTILFVGVGKTPYNNPLIHEDQSVVETKYKSFFDGLYTQGYKSFVESVVIVTPFGKNALKQKCITMDICIRAEQLRKHLEKNEIIRRFGL